MKKQFIQKTEFARTVTAATLVFVALSPTPSTAKEKPEQVSPERARANFGQQVVLAPDDARFPMRPPVSTIRQRTDSRDASTFSNAIPP